MELPIQSFVFLLLCLSTILASVDYDSKVCEDEEVWCEIITEYCHEPTYAIFLNNICPKSCANCSILNCSYCEHGCEEDKSKTINCICRDGYQLASDKKSCKDVNECVTSPCESHQRCQNLKGGFTCHSVKYCNDITANHTVKRYTKDECCEITHGKCGQDALTRYSSLPRRPINIYPWMASLLVGKRLRCTGVIISDKWVLVPSECLRSVRGKSTLKQLRINAGILSSTKASFTAVREVTKVKTVRSLEYSWETVSLLKLNESLTFSPDYIHPICMPNKESPAIQENCVAFGYVKRDSFDGLYDSLAEMPLTITNNSQCRKLTDGEEYDIFSEDKVTICAGNQKLEYKNCLGNSGGILVCQRKSSCDWYLAGVKYRGKGCAGPGEEVTSFLKMEKFETSIENHMNSEKIILFPH